MVISREQIQHCVTGSAGHGFDDLIWDGRDTQIVDGDSIEGLEVMHDMQITALLVNAKPARLIRQVRRLVYTGSNLLLEQLDDLF